MKILVLLTVFLVEFEVYTSSIVINVTDQQKNHGQTIVVDRDKIFSCRCPDGKFKIGKKYIGEIKEKVRVEK